MKVNITRTETAEFGLVDGTYATPVLIASVLARGAIKVTVEGPDGTETWTHHTKGGDSMSVAG